MEYNNDFLVWNHKDFQERVLWLWTELAKYYKDNKWVAGYNPLNGPTDPKHTQLIGFYNKVHATIRAVDANHIIFLDGNTFASDFSHFGDVHKGWANTAYSIHDYSNFGFPTSSQEYVGTKKQKLKLRLSYEKKRKWMDERGLCVWNGEWGPVYARRPYDGDATHAINKTRYRVLKDQLEIYKSVGILFCFLYQHFQDNLSHFIFIGPFELVHLVMQRHRASRDGLC